MGIQGVTRGYRGLQRVTKGDRACEQKHTLACPFAAVHSYSRFSFHRAVLLHSVERVSTCPMPHSKRLAKVEASPFPTSTYFHFTAELNFSASKNGVKSCSKVRYPGRESCGL